MRLNFCIRSFTLIFCSTSLSTIELSLLRLPTDCPFSTISDLWLFIFSFSSCSIGDTASTILASDLLLLMSVTDFGRVGFLPPLRPSKFPSKSLLRFLFVLLLILLLVLWDGILDTMLPKTWAALGDLSNEDLLLLGGTGGGGAALMNDPGDEFPLK